MNTCSATLTEKTQLTYNTVALKYTKPENISYLAGQFFQWILETPEGNTVKRSYSIASSPSDPYLEFFIKVYPDGIASNHIKTMNIGDTLSMQGPLGRFTLDPEQTAPVQLVATGTGIAPMMGILQDALVYQGRTEPIHLLFGLRKEEDVFWVDRLDALSDAYPQFSYTLTLSQPSETWKGAQGRVTDHLTSLCSETQYFLCGSVEMVKDVRGMLMEASVPPQHIHFEIF